MTILVCKNFPWALNWIFGHPAWAIVSYISGPPASGTVGTKSMGVFANHNGHPVPPRILQVFSDSVNPLIQVHSAPVTYSYADPRGEKDESIKIVIVGAPGVGKTAIAQVREKGIK